MSEPFDVSTDMFEALVSQDQNAWESLYLATSTSLTRYATRRLLNKCDAIDCVHMAFVRLKQNVEKWDKEQKKLKWSYLIGAVRNEITVFLRKKREVTLSEIIDDEKLGSAEQNIPDRDTSKSSRWLEFVADLIRADPTSTIEEVMLRCSPLNEDPLSFEESVKIIFDFADPPLTELEREILWGRLVEESTYLELAGRHYPLFEAGPPPDNSKLTNWVNTRMRSGLKKLRDGIDRRFGEDYDF